jgi:hypothetical protein
MSGGVSEVERRHAVVTILQQLVECQSAVLTLMNEPEDIALGTYIAQLRVITQTINRAHSTSLNFQNVAQLASNLVNDHMRKGVRRADD